jgi:hypothetical protein
MNTSQNTIIFQSTIDKSELSIIQIASLYQETVKYGQNACHVLGEAGVSWGDLYYAEAGLIKILMRFRVKDCSNNTTPSSIMLRSLSLPRAAARSAFKQHSS